MTYMFHNERDCTGTKKHPAWELPTGSLHRTGNTFERTSLQEMHGRLRRAYLPGRSSALSRMSGLLVPASTTTPCVVAKPSSSTSS